MLLEVREDQVDRVRGSSRAANSIHVATVTIRPLLDKVKPEIFDESRMLLPE